MGLTEVAARGWTLSRVEPPHRPRSPRKSGGPAWARGGRHGGAGPPCGGLLGLGLEDLGKCLQIGLEGVLGLCWVMTIPPGGLVRLGAIERRHTGVRSRNGDQHAARLTWWLSAGRCWWWGATRPPRPAVNAPWPESSRRQRSLASRKPFSPTSSRFRPTAVAASLISEGRRAAGWTPAPLSSLASMTATGCCWPTAPRSPAVKPGLITGIRFAGWTSRSRIAAYRPGGLAALRATRPGGSGTPGGRSGERPFQRRCARPSCPVSTTPLPTQGN